MSEAAAREHQVRLRGLVRVPVEISGTRGGFRKFCRGEIELQDASRPILADEQARCRANGVRFIELPIAYDALTLAVSTRNRFATRLRLDELRRVWERGAEGESAPPGRPWTPPGPATPLALYGPGGRLRHARLLHRSGDRGGRRDPPRLPRQRRRPVPRRRHRRRPRPRSASCRTPTPSATPTACACCRSTPVAPRRERDRRPLPAACRGRCSCTSPSAPPRVPTCASSSSTTSPRPRLASGAGLVPLPRQAYAIVAERFRQRRLGTAFDGRSAVGLSFEQLVEREGAP